MKLESLPLKSLILWEVFSILCLTILTSIIFIIFKPHTILWYILLWIVGALFIFLCLFYCPLLYISYKFGVSNEYFILKRGVFFNKTHLIKKEQISFISVTKYPLTPLISLSTLIIVAPRSKIIIPSMSHKKNIQIMNTLLDNNFDNI